MAVVPVSKRERDAATSQAVIIDGVSARVGVDWITGVLVRVGSGVVVGSAGFVAVGEGRGVSVGASGFVAVGEGREVGLGAPALVALGAERESVGVDVVGAGSGVEVDSIAGFAIVVGEEKGVAVTSASLVTVGFLFDSTVGVSDNDTDVSGILVEFARVVAEEPRETNSVGEDDVDAGGKA